MGETDELIFNSLMYLKDNKEGSYSAAGGFFREGNFRNTTLDYGVEHVHVFSAKKIEFSYGVIISTLLYSQFEGVSKSWTNVGSNAGINGSSIKENPGRRMIPQIGVGLAHPISLTEKLKLIPKIHTSTAVLGEYDTYKRWSSYFELSIRWIRKE